MFAKNRSLLKENEVIKVRTSILGLNLMDFILKRLSFILNKNYLCSRFEVFKSGLVKIE